MKVTSVAVPMGLSVLALSLGGVLATAQEDISVKRGEYISIVGGCHDCHTEGYPEAGGKIDPLKAMKGNPLIGWQGPWGTIYATNLRLVDQI